MTPRLQQSQEMNVQELRRMMQREVEPVHRPFPMRLFWIPIAVGSVLIGVMSGYYTDHRHAAYRSTPSADQTIMQNSRTNYDWNTAQEEAIRREYGKIKGGR